SIVFLISLGIIAIIIFAIAFFLLRWGIIKSVKYLKTIKCPKCGAKPPLFRIPKNIKQAFFGGWTCPKCNIDIDRKGHIRK
ncbi:hypothetical protein ACFL6I_23885, partial [candidate division KSB1 bacterium]